ncbi:hypothetical protein [Kurlavirus BKC-1]|uniref:Uncharacterized protein n=2 Tax=unclassified Marseillevirus TaxID=1813598 RepID=A0AA96J3S0_9VIRU|nr:hypothetical protein [Kurlavirus BKC-1]QZX43818.1 hypothetical protein MarQu_236 [Marseillevirus sp.]WNL50385.1 hypothetical protein MarDSR_346 [Marseillevirus sp.]
MYRPKISEGSFSKFEVAEEQRPVVCGLENISVSQVGTMIHIKWDIPRIWTPQNLAVQLNVETKVHGKGVDSNKIDRNIQGVSFRATRGLDYIVEATPLLFCLGKNYGPTTKILVAL